MIDRGVINIVENYGNKEDYDIVIKPGCCSCCGELRELLNWNKKNGVYLCSTCYLQRFYPNQLWE